MQAPTKVICLLAWSVAVFDRKFTLKKDSKSTFPCGSPLCTYLYNAERKKDHGKYYRFKQLDGSFIRLKDEEGDYIVSPSECYQKIKELLASEGKKFVAPIAKSRSKEVINGERGLRPQGEYAPNSVGAFLEPIIRSYEMECPHRVGKRRHNDEKSGLVKITRDIHDTMVAHLTREYLHEMVWINMLRSQKKNYRTLTCYFFDQLIKSGATPRLTSNPFDGHKENSFYDEDRTPLGRRNKEIEMKKKRNILPLTTFQEIRVIAQQNDFHFLVDAMDLSLCLLLRRQDILDLRFDKHIEGQILRKTISKSKNLGAKKVPTITTDLGQDKNVLSILKRSRARLDANNPCPFVIHEKTGRKSSEKEHQDQVLADRLSRTFRKCAEQAPSLIGYSGLEFPTFHEIRALGAELLRDQGVPEQEISSRLGHADIKTTRNSYDTHKKTIEHNIVPAFALDNLLTSKVVSINKAKNDLASSLDFLDNLQA